MPHGPVLGPALFLIFMNYLSDDINSRRRLFADDCILYRQISSDSDQHLLQEDLDRLTTYEKTWGIVPSAELQCPAHLKSKNPQNLQLPAQRCSPSRRAVIKVSKGGSTVQFIMENSHKSGHQKHQIRC